LNRPATIHHLVVIHHHLRPGGVRSVIDAALPAIAKAAGPSLRRITLAVGEPSPDQWGSDLSRALRPVGMDIFVEPAFGYFSEQRSAPAFLRMRIRDALCRLIPAPDAAGTLVWFHNPALGRNAILGDEVGRLGKKIGVPAILHHHDFWCANRWTRWSEMRKCGYHSPAAAARAIFADQARSAHIAINSTDRNSLRAGFGRHAYRLPNPLPSCLPVSPANVKRAARWLANATGSDVPIWICPTRVLRRKNIAESILLARWLRPDACLAITAGVSSSDELDYASRLESAARDANWNVRFGLLAGRQGPPVRDLIAASEAVVLTSVQEGFGMGFVEAHSKPLIARALPEILPDLRALGYRFPHLYKEVLVAPELVDRKAEAARQKRLWTVWRAGLPGGWRRHAEKPLFLELSGSDPVPFSRLTLTAQLEILALPPDLTWNACKSHNPKLNRLRASGLTGLEPTPGPKPDVLHDATAFAREWLRIATSIPARPHAGGSAPAAQKALAGRALATSGFFPIQHEIR